MKYLFHSPRFQRTNVIESGAIFMFEININIYALYGIAIISFILLIAVIFIFIAYMCHDKRKFRSIDKYNELKLDKTKTYNENLKEYKENIEKAGVKTNKKFKFDRILFIRRLIKRDSE